MGLDHWLKVKRNGESVFLVEWRKENQFHKWFIDTLKDGNDDQEDVEVKKGDLEAFYEALVECWENKNPEKMPTQEGFFFGSTDYDEWYWEAIEENIPKIKELIDTFDWEKEELYYGCWW